MGYFRAILVVSFLSLLSSCGGGGGGVGGGGSGGGSGGGGGGGSTPVGIGGGGGDNAGASAGSSVQKVLVPVDSFNVPCGQVSDSANEDEIIIDVPESQVENCPADNSFFRLPSFLISTAYAAEEAPNGEPKQRYRLKCLQRCRLKGSEIEFDIPTSDLKELEKQLLLFQDLKDWFAILSLRGNKILLQMKKENNLEEEENKESFKRKFREKIRLDVEEAKQKRDEERRGGDVEGDDKEGDNKEPSPGGVEDKKGLKELGPPDLKTFPPSHHLKLLVGQRWESGDMMGRIQTCNFQEGEGHRILSLQYFNPHPHRTDLSPFISIKGLKDGRAGIACKIDVQGFGLADLIVDVMVEDPSKPKVEPPWEWHLPDWKDNLHYFGEIPECRMAGDADNPTGLVDEVGGLQKMEEGVYQMFFGEESRWMGGMKGGFRFRKLMTSNPGAAEIFFSRQFREFIIRSKKQGTALISWEAVEIRDLKQVVPEDAWKKVQILATVFPFFETDAEKAQGGRLCPGEIKIEEPKLDKCPASPAAEAPPPPEPDHTVDPPATLTADETALAAKLYQLFNAGNTPAVCKDEMLRRQSKKLAHCFYQVPKPDYLLASCVTCANKVGSALMECLQDEKIACFKISNIGRGNFPVLDVPMHAATALFPACTSMDDESIVLDTWFAPGNWIPPLHRHRVFKLKDWKSGKLTDFGLQREQSNLPK